MTKVLKDFIYLDEDLVDSLYAQLYQKEIVEQIFNDSSQSGVTQNNQNSSTETDEVSPMVGASVGVAKAQINGRTSSSETISNSVVTSESQGASESTKFALNRFKYLEVLDELSDKDLLKNSEELNQYSFIELENTFKFYDFSQHVEAYDHESSLMLLFANYYIEHEREISLEAIQDDLKKAKVAVKHSNKLDFFNDQEDARKFIKIYRSTLNFRRIGIVSTALNKIFKNNVLFLSDNNELIICNKSFLKTDTLLLTLSKNVRAKVVGKIINDTAIMMDTDDISNYLTKDNSTSEEKGLHPNYINAGASFLTMNYLQHFYGVKKELPVKFIQAVGIEYITD